MAMRVCPKVFLFNRLATNHYGRGQKLDFARLTASLAKTVKTANKTHSDGSGCQQIKHQLVARIDLSLCVFREIWARAEGQVDNAQRDAGGP